MCSLRLGETMKKIAPYARVSTDKQTVDNQLDLRLKTDPD